jgi:hypothetical protein
MSPQMKQLSDLIKSRASDVMERIDAAFLLGDAAWVDGSIIDRVSALHPEFPLKRDRISGGEADGGYVMNVVEHLRGEDRRVAVGELSKLTLPSESCIRRAILDLDEERWHTGCGDATVSMIEIAFYEIWSNGRRR